MGGLSVSNLRLGLSLLVLLGLAGYIPASAQVEGQAPNPQPSVAVAAYAAARDELQSLSISGLGLHAEPPVAGETTERPEFTREMVQVQWRQGDPIELYVIRPHDISKPRPVIYLYSYPSETTRFQDDKYCARVTENGFAAIGFVSSMTGQRYHDRPMKEWFVSELPESLTASVHDVQMILNYLAGRGDFDLSEVGMFGQGSGATIAILSASVDERIRILDLLDPWGDWPQWFAQSSLVPENERSVYLTPDYLARVAPLDPVKWLPELKAKTIRIQVVKDDTIAPQSAADRILAVAPRTVEVVQYNTTRELYNASGGGRMFEWIKDQIASSSRPAKGTEGTPVSPQASDHKSLP